MHSLTVSISLALGEPHGETHAVYQGEALRPQDLSGICDALCSLGTYTSWTIFHKCVLALVFVVAKEKSSTSPGIACRRGFTKGFGNCQVFPSHAQYTARNSNSVVFGKVPNQNRVAK